MVHLIPHVRDYPNQEYKAQLCYKALLCTPEALLPTWTIYLMGGPLIQHYGVGVQIFRFGNAVSPWPISSKTEGLDPNAAY